jgi:hypothetical protein
MNPHEALKMAIEQMGAYSFKHLCDYQCEDKELLEVIKACKEALAQPAQDDIIEEQRKTIRALNMCIGGEGSTTTENITRIGRLEAEIESLKQPAQEPVAWLHIKGERKEVGYHHGKT